MRSIRPTIGRRLQWLAAFAAISWAPAFGQVATQSAEQKEPGTLEEIIVTSQKRSENLENVPITVSTVTGATLDANAIDTSTGLSRITPALFMFSEAASVSPFLRGVGTQYPNAGLESEIAVYFDDSYLTRATAGLFDLIDVNRIETLKGPQGTLYGRNSAGGAIRIITNDPTQDFEVKGDITTGSFNRVTERGLINIPITSQLAARFSVTGDRNTGFETDPYTSNRGNRNTYATLGKILYTPTDQLSIKLSADYSHKDDSEGQIFAALANAPPEQTGLALGGVPRQCFYCTSEDFGGRSKYGNDSMVLEQSGAALRIDYRLSSVVLSSISAFRHDKSSQPGDIDSTNLPLLHATNNPTTNTLSEELQAVSQLSGPFSYVGGLYFYTEHSATFEALWGEFISGGFGVPSGPDVGASNGGVNENDNARITTRSLAPYAQGTYSVTDQWDITVGGRYTDEKKGQVEHEIYATNVGPVPLVLLTEDPRYLVMHEFTPKATVSYKPFDKTMFYATYAKGFKSGGFNSTAFGVAPTLLPETLNEYEVGWKTEIDRIRFNGALFDYDYKNLIVQSVDFHTGLNQSLNAANAKIYGAEFELTAVATDHLELGAGGSALHSDYQNFLGTAIVPASATSACATTGGAACLGDTTVNRNLSGNELIFAPKFSGFLRAVYTQPLGRDIGTLTYNALANYTGRYFNDNANQFPQGGYTLLSAGITWAAMSENFNVGVFGNNLTGKEYTASIVPGSYGGFYQPAPPRTWGARFGFKFK